MRISKEFRFEASHVLPKHSGKCSRLHGHSYRVEVALTGSIVEKTGFVLDYAELKKVVQPVIDGLDHVHLNILIKYPSAENIAIFIYNQVCNQLEVNNVACMQVTVHETDNTSATYPCNLVRHGFVSLDLEDNSGWEKPSEKDARKIRLAVNALELLEAKE